MCLKSFISETLDQANVGKSLLVVNLKKNVFLFKKRSLLMLYKESKTRLKNCQPMNKNDGNLHVFCTMVYIIGRCQTTIVNVEAKQSESKL